MKKLFARGGRSIQAPPVTYKVLWLQAFATTDDRWVRKAGTPYPIVVNFNKPMTQHMQQVLQSAHASCSTDVTGWDRRLPAPLLKLFVYQYMRAHCCGVPDFMLDYFHEGLVHTKMAFPNGLVVQKSQGNPSGFPNTLRLNCVLQRLVNEVAQKRAFDKLEENGQMKEGAKLTDLVYSFYVGDDGLNVARNADGLKALDLAFEEWKNFPWEVKLEGRVVYDGSENCMAQTPPFVSRTPVKIGGRWYLELHKPGKILCKVFSQANGVQDTPEMRAEREMGIITQLAHTIVMHAYGLRYDRCVHALDAYLRDRDGVGLGPWVPKLWRLLA